MDNDPVDFWEIWAGVWCALAGGLFAVSLAIIYETWR